MPTQLKLPDSQALTLTMRQALAMSPTVTGPARRRPCGRGAHQPTRTRDGAGRGGITGSHGPRWRLWPLTGSGLRPSRSDSGFEATGPGVTVTSQARTLAACHPGRPGPAMQFEMRKQAVGE